MRTLSKEKKWSGVESKTRGNVQQLALVVLLKTTQKLGFFPSLTDIPKQIIEHIAQTVRLPIPQPEEWKEYGKSRTWKRQHRFVRDYLQLSPFNDQARQIMIDTMSELSGSKDEPADLVNAAIDRLIRECYELPVYNT
jgi:hypothetical protein